MIAQPKDEFDFLTPDYEGKVRSEATKQGVDPDFAAGIMRQESRGNPRARSPKGAIGLMQLMPGTAKQLGVNPHNPDENIRGGVTYLRQQLDTFGDKTRTAAAYNAGPGRARDGSWKNIKETRDYVDKTVGPVKADDDEFDFVSPTPKGGAPIATPAAIPQLPTKKLSPSESANMSAIDKLLPDLVAGKHLTAPQKPSTASSNRTVLETAAPPGLSALSEKGLEAKFEESKTAGKIPEARAYGQALAKRHGWRYEEGDWPSIEPPASFGKQTVAERQANWRERQQRIGHEKGVQSGVEGVIRSNLILPDGVPIPKAVTETVADFGGRAAQATGAAIKGFGDVIGGPGVGMAGRAVPEAISQAGQSIMDSARMVSEEAGAPPGLRKTVVGGLGASAPALAAAAITKNPATVIGILSGLEAKGEGASTGKAAITGLANAAGMKLMGMASEALSKPAWSVAEGSVVPTPGLAPRLARSLGQQELGPVTQFAGRTAANTLIPTAQQTLMTGQMPSGQDVAANLLPGAGFAVAHSPTSRATNRSAVPERGAERPQLMLPAAPPEAVRQGLVDLVQTREGAVPQYGAKVGPFDVGPTGEAAIGKPVSQPFRRIEEVGPRSVAGYGNELTIPPAAPVRPSMSAEEAPIPVARTIPRVETAPSGAEAPVQQHHSQKQPRTETGQFDGPPLSDEVLALQRQYDRAQATVSSLRKQANAATTQAQSMAIRTALEDAGRRARALGLQLNAAKKGTVKPSEQVSVEQVNQQASDQQGISPAPTQPGIEPIQPPAYMPSAPPASEPVTGAVEAAGSGTVGREGQRPVESTGSREPVQDVIDRVVAGRGNHTATDLPALRTQLQEAGLSPHEQVQVLNDAGYGLQSPVDLAAATRAIGNSEQGIKPPTVTHKQKRFGELTVLGKLEGGDKLLVMNNEGKASLIQNPAGETGNKSITKFDAGELGKVPDVPWSELGNLSDPFPSKASILKVAPDSGGHLSQVPAELAQKHFPEYWKRSQEALASGFGEDVAKGFAEATSKPGQPEDPSLIAKWRAEVNDPTRFSANPVDSLVKGMVVAAYDTYRDVQQFGQWSQRMVKQFGKKVRPMLRELFERMQYKGQTETPEFKRWFGESKIADEGGNPLRVYHGTGQDVDVFKKPSKGEATTHFLDIGYHFGDTKIANQYAEAAIESNGYRKGLSRDSKYGNPVVYPVYLKIEHPADLRNGFPADLHDAVVRLGLENGLSENSKYIKLAQVDSLGLLGRVQQLAGRRALRDAFTSLGYDGARYGVLGSENYVVFKPEQIKSATGNRGAFDPADPDIVGQDPPWLQKLHKMADYLTAERPAPPGREGERGVVTVRRGMGAQPPPPRGGSTSAPPPASGGQAPGRAKTATPAVAEKPGVSDFLLKFRRAVILSSAQTVGKLSAAATGRNITTPIEEGIGGILSQIPGLRGVAAKAPREGGFSLKAEGQALKQGFSKETVREAIRTAKTGVSNLDVEHGGKTPADPDFLELFGRMHGSLKTQPKRAEFFRGTVKRTQAVIRDAIKGGMSEADARSYAQRPEVQAAIGAKAYEDANRSILMNDNAAVNLWKSALKGLEGMGEEGSLTRKIGQGTALTGKFLMPIVKIPTNFVAEGSSYAIGGAKAVGQLLAAKGTKNLTPDQADYVMRNLKKQTVGAGLMTLGWVFADSIGGYYDPHDKNKEVEPGTMKIGDHTIPRWLTHTPALEALSIGATARRVYDKATKKQEDQPLLSGGYAAGKGIVKEIPFFDTPLRISEALANWKGAKKFAGETVRGTVIPPDVQRVARQLDQPAPMTLGKFVTGQPIQRKPQTFLEELEMGIPGLRSKIGNQQPGQRPK